MLDAIINQVHWPFFVELFMIVLLLWVIVKLLYIHIAEFFQGLLREFRSLLQLRIERGALNALTIVALVLMLTLYLFLDPFRHLVELSRVPNIETPSEAPYIVAAWFFVTSIVGIMSSLAE
jgi:hypothetical protein